MKYAIGCFAGILLGTAISGLMGEIARCIENNVVYTPIVVFSIALIALGVVVLLARKRIYKGFGY